MSPLCTGGNVSEEDVLGLKGREMIVPGCEGVPLEDERLICAREMIGN